MDELDLRVGERSIVTLEGLGTAGYQWSVIVDNPGVARVDRLDTVPRVDGSPIGSRDESFAVVATGVGETVARFTLSRSFEPSKPPRSTREIRIHVAAETIDTGVRYHQP